MFVEQDKWLRKSDINLPSAVGFEKARSSTVAAYSQVDQRKRAKRVVSENLSEDKIAGSGFSAAQLTSLIQEDTVAPAIKDMYEKEYSNLVSKGINISELRNRYLKEIESERAKGDDDRISVWDNITGFVHGYAIDDPINAPANLLGGMAGAVKKGASFGTRMLASMFENTAVESILMANVDGRMSDKLEAVGYAGVFGGAVPVIGKGLGKLFDKTSATYKNVVDALVNKGVSKEVADKAIGETQDEMRRKAYDILKSSGNKNEVLGKLDEELVRTPSGPAREFLEGFKDQLDNIPTKKFDTAVKLAGEMEELAAKGDFRGRNLVDEFYVEIGQNRVTGKNLDELLLNVETTLKESGEFTSDQVQKTLDGLRKQEIIGEFDTYRVLGEKVPRRSVKDVDGKPLDITNRPMIYATREEAEAGLKKLNFEGEAFVTKQSNGRFAVVTTDDTARGMPGTRGFATKKEAEVAMERYANNFGVSKEDLKIETVPSLSKNPDIEVDHVIKYKAPVRPLNDPEALTNTDLDRISIKKDKVLSEPSEEVFGSPVDMPEEVPVKDLEGTLDRLAVDGRVKTSKEFKRFNAEFKESVRVFEEFKGCLNG